MSGQRTGEASTACGSRALDDPHFPCVLPEGHTPPHKDENGVEWPCLARPKGFTNEVKAVALLADVRQACATLIAERVRIFFALGLKDESVWTEEAALEAIRVLRSPKVRPHPSDEAEVGLTFAEALAREIDHPRKFVGVDRTEDDRPFVPKVGMRVMVHGRADRWEGVLGKVTDEPNEQNGNRWGVVADSGMKLWFFAFHLREHWEPRTETPREPCGDLLTDDPMFAYECNRPIGHRTDHAYVHDERVIATWPQREPRRPTATAAPTQKTTRDFILDDMSGHAENDCPCHNHEECNQAMAVLVRRLLVELRRESPRAVEDGASAIGVSRHSGWNPEEKRRQRLGIRVGDRISTKHDKRPGRLIDLFIDSGLAWAVVRLDEHDHEHGSLYDPELIEPETDCAPPPVPANIVGTGAIVLDMCKVDGCPNRSIDLTGYCADHPREVADCASYGSTTPAAVSVADESRQPAPAGSPNAGTCLVDGMSGATCEKGTDGCIAHPEAGHSSGEGYP